MVNGSEVAAARGYLAANRPKTALAYIGGYLASRPDDVEALCVLTQTQLALGDSAGAWVTARHLIELDSHNEWAWRLYSVAAASVGHWEESRRAAHVARDVEPEEWRTHAQIVQADMWAHAITKATYAEARIAIGLAPDEPEVFIMAGNLAMADLNFKRAEEAFTTALSIDPNHIEALNRLAVARLHRGKVSDAAVSLMDLLADDPESKRTFVRLRGAAKKALDRINGLLWLPVILGVATILCLGFGPEIDVLSTVSRLLVATEVILSVAGIAFYVARIKKAMGDQFSRFVRSVPRLSISLVVFAALQAVAVMFLLSVVVLVALPSVTPIFLCIYLAWGMLLLFVCVVAAAATHKTLH